MTRLKPMRINSNQITRLFKQPIGSGFLAYRFDEEHLEVAEFVVSESGELLKPDGMPLEYICRNGDTIRYHVVSEKV